MAFALVICAAATASEAHVEMAHVRVCRDTTNVY
jgi:hypothetical protein